VYLGGFVQRFKELLWKRLLSEWDTFYDCFKIEMTWCDVKIKFCIKIASVSYLNLAMKPFRVVNFPEYRDKFFENDRI
jgi:hypothetical protein